MDAGFEPTRTYSRRLQKIAFSITKLRGICGSNLKFPTFWSVISMDVNKIDK